LALRAGLLGHLLHLPRQRHDLQLHRLDLPLQGLDLPLAARARRCPGPSEALARAIGITIMGSTAQASSP
jgi:hypothetical protein